MSFERLHPSPVVPRAAASAVLFRGDSVLLVQRGPGPRAQVWSFPGGHIEPGERAEAAARREVLEETQLACHDLSLLDVHDVFIRDHGATLVAHYVIAVYYGAAEVGEPCASSEVAQAKFVALADLGGLRLTEGAHKLILRASQHMVSHGRGP